MSKLNIEGIVEDIKSKATIYTPVIEAIVNSIDAISETHRKDGQITVILHRDLSFDFKDDALPFVKSVEIIDNGIGFTQQNRDSFDTLRSPLKKQYGGKGFGRFMFHKYFNDIRVESIYKENEQFYCRKFHFGKIEEIITNETNIQTNAQELQTKIFLENVKNENLFEKEIETIARKITEKLLIFFIDDSFICPTIILKDTLKNSNDIILNDYIKENKEIQDFKTESFIVHSPNYHTSESFIAKVFKIYYAGSQKSKIILSADNRAVTETALHNYVPEFEDDFYDTINNKDRNFIVKIYVLGAYLNKHVSIERETFNFDKEKSDQFFHFSQSNIEKEAAKIAVSLFPDDVNSRLEKKKKAIEDYVMQQAPWHKPYLKELKMDAMPYGLSNYKIEFELQKIKFEKEQQTRIEMGEILSSENGSFDEKFTQIISKVTEIGKNDLAHYVCNRKKIIELFQELRKRDNSGSASLENEIHKIIFPMNRDDRNTDYEEHNLWLLDERLVFSQYTASDRKIHKSKKGKEPDLIVFYDKIQLYRNGSNEFSNPITIFEFKRPKRTAYTEDENPITQVGKYLGDVRNGKYEIPEGVEKIKANENTPAYAYIVCDIEKRINEFAIQGQLTLSPDGEGYFGYHSGYKMYIEIISYKKLLNDAVLRNKIFFKKLQID